MNVLALCCLSDLALRCGECCEQILDPGAYPRWRDHFLDMLAYLIALLGLLLRSFLHCAQTYCDLIKYPHNMGYDYYPLYQ